MSADEGHFPGSSAGRERYDHAEVEPKWQRYWEDNGTFAARRMPGRPKRYLLDMFPYPSGAGLHVGHPEGYTATDIVARFERMRGVDVLHPMGWDAFGLPAEQYAIQTGTHPAKTTNENIATFRRQLRSLGFSYDWSRELSTTDDAYVRWTQWIFLLMFEQKLAFQDEIPVNWCPALGTVLANEEVIDGKSERGGHPVVRTPLRQWMLRITAYADRLLEDLAEVDWPEGTLTMQREWIGRSEGAEIDFGIEGSDEKISVFTTRPDTLFGVTFMVLAPEHPLVEKLTTADRRADVDAYVKAAASKSDRDRLTHAKTKTGVPIGGHCLHPLTGAKIPVWIGDYVIGSYGTGAVMGVPGHDERDFEFAKQYGVPIVEVVSATKSPVGDLPAAFVEDGFSVNSGEFSGLSTSECKKAIVQKLDGVGRGKKRTSYKLRDWVFSRQRYWGEPIPIYFPVELPEGGDPHKGAKAVIRFDQPIAVDASELPIRLPNLADYRPGDDPAGPLARALDWRFFQKDGKWYARETNTMPQWAGSCWYYLRFLDPKNEREAWSKEAYDAWMPVDLYVGGAEHAVLHLLYARFWHKVLFDRGFVKDKEPFKKLVHQGIILGEDGEKMSKARGNVVNPDDIVRDHGADALRLYEMFMGPLEAVKPWQSSQIQGVVRFRDRVWATCTRPLFDSIDDETKRLLHKTVQKVEKAYETLSFNTAISTLMIFTNHLAGMKEIPREAAEKLVLMVSPLAPHLGEELWSRLGHDKSLAYEPWPTFDPALTVDDVIEMPVQVNGKVRGHVTLSRTATQDDAVKAALAVESVKPFTEGKTIKKVVFVAGRILNLVVG
jgi:leucyl-tRNA synthetase